MENGQRKRDSKSIYGYQYDKIIKLKKEKFTSWK